MKTWTYLLLLAPLILCRETFAQKRFSDGEVVYSVKVDLPPGTPEQAAAAFKDSKLIYSFKNYLFRSDMDIGKMTYTSIHNSKEHSAVTLIDAGPTKYLIRMDQDDLAKESARYAGIRFTDENDTRQIAGYACKKAIGRLKDGSTFTVYYTPDLVPESADYSERFKGLKGLPLAFEMTTSHGIKMTMTAVSVSVAPQPSARFNTPTSGYREITYGELENMRKK